ncbi:MAG: molybdenum cofactor guanylyltransferase [Gammaproteobacteria bacterium]|nr:molybdenum cofactor guanylyltransferase [Gammaproteobacteria bacterium]
MKTNKISCIILAGGEGKRMNGNDKGLIEFNSKPLIAHVINSLQNQVDDFVISANRNVEHYQQFSPDVIPDGCEKHGPLSGIAAALSTCKHEQVLVIPCDMPFLPYDLVKTLITNFEHSDIAIVEVQERLQLVFLMKKSLLTSVQDHLTSGKHKLMQWVGDCSHTTVDFTASADAFRNINSIQDINNL